MKRRKRGSAWITSNLSGRRSPNFWTKQSCFVPSNWSLPTPLKQTHGALKAWVQSDLSSKLYLLTTCRACSTRMLFDSCRVFFGYAKIEQAKEKALLTGLLLARKGEFNEDSTLIVIVIYGSNRDNLWADLQGTVETRAGENCSCRIMFAPHTES